MQADLMLLGLPEPLFTAIESCEYLRGRLRGTWITLNFDDAGNVTGSQVLDEIHSATLSDQATGTVDELDNFRMQASDRKDE